MSTSLRLFVSSAVLAVLAGAPTLEAQNLKIAIIDSDRVIAESTKGQAAIASLKKLEEQKRAELSGIQQEITDLRKRIEDGAQALAQDRLKELQKQMEDKVIAARRKQDDAQREFEAAQAEAFRGIEEEIIRVIDQVGKEGGYTMIFNKFRSGLVFASDSVDITNEVLARFNQSAKP
jgi:outer membrane protein